MRHCVVMGKQYKTTNQTKQVSFGPDQTESICERQFNIAKMTISLFDRVENTVG